jgi:hypothetical protein
MTKRKRAQRREVAEHRDSFNQWCRENLRKKEREHEEWIRHARDIYPKINRPALVELFDKDWSRSGVGYPNWFEIFARVLKSRKRKQEYKDRLRNLVLTICDKAPGVIILEYNICCVLLASEEWVRPLDKWKPKGKSRHTHYRSLIDHLLVRYPVPLHFYELVGANHRGWNGMSFFARVAGGEKITRCFDGSILKHPRIPMTKRMCHHLMQFEDEIDFLCCVRKAQVMALGGDEELAKKLSWSFLGREIFKDEEFWLSVIRWFCGQSEFDHNLIGPLLDYIKAKHDGDDGFSMKGRTIRSLARDMEEWHRQLALADKLTDLKFKQSGFREGTWELEGQHGGKRQKFVWTIREIMSPKVLHAEGRLMKHCVYSYARDIQKGTTSIWTLKRNEERMLTVEVLTNSKKIVQARGKCNRPPKKYELSVLGRWARENGFVMDVNRYW